VKNPNHLSQKRDDHVTQLSDSERLAWIRLARTDGIGPATFHKLIRRFGTGRKAIEALPQLMSKASAARGKPVYALDRAEHELALTTAKGAVLVAYGEPAYPDMLRHIDDAPPLLCMSGNFELLQRRSVGIVGARTASANARKLARILSNSLAEAGFLVTSGLARGIDTAAHEAASPARTAAVIAGGMDHLYPPENADLQKAIARDGVLITEMAIGTAPRAEHFPRRNRIISGMSKAVIVVEAALRSGSLITARFANEQNREVFAVPGSPLDPRCEGTNKLIKDGANILTSVNDVLDFLQGETAAQHGSLFEREAEPLLSPDEEADEKTRRTVLGLLSANSVDVDDLIREADCAPEQVMAVLLELEVAGRISRSASGLVALVA
jgi:DNA processing protein